MKARFLLLVAVLLCAQAWAAPPGKQQYIVKLKNPNSAAALKNEVTHGGGHVDYEGWDRLVVTLPDNAVEAIARHASTKYMQLVTSHSTTSAGNATSLQSASSVSRGDADGLPETPAKSSPLRASLHPTPLSFSTWDSGTYSYDGAGNITGIGSDTFTYDSLSRLSTANIKGNTESYSYDAYGNLKLKTTTPAGGTPLIVDLTPSTANNNHLAAQAYDTAGNLTGNAGETNVYDSFNMMREKDVSGYGSEYYLYTANDERIAVISNPCVGGTTPQNCSGALITVSPREESGKVLSQFDLPYQQFATGPWLWLEHYVYRDGLLLAAERPNAEGGRRHFHLDHLGSPRLVTGPSGQQIAAHDYYPFGVEITPLRQETAAGLDREDPMKFTGHERDFNIGTSTENANYNDYMHARFTTPQWGRFMSVDPLLGSPHRPQSWNRYAYVNSNPLRYTDPSGMGIVDWLKSVMGIHTSDPKFTVYGEITVESTPLPLSATERFVGGLFIRAIQASPPADMQQAAVQGNSFAFSAAYWQMTMIPFMMAGDEGGGAGEDAVSESAMEDATATGFRGREGFELTNAPYQPARNARGEVNGISYSGHAFDQMQNRGIMPSVVENTIGVGRASPGRGNVLVYYDPVNHVRVLTDIWTGRVVTVMRGAP